MYAVIFAWHSLPVICETIVFVRPKQFHTDKNKITHP